MTPLTLPAQDATVRVEVRVAGLALLLLGLLIPSGGSAI
jgi:hypothetical protein